VKDSTALERDYQHSDAREYLAICKPLKDDAIPGP
jgi:hypothetical protein